ncbi:MAG: hypothetical protein FJ040_01325 [Chloroflexi bacterium]|nr:hypothetical protein [Chloroflexota bacterium]
MTPLFRIILMEHIRSQRILVELIIVGAMAFFVLRNLNDAQAIHASLVLYAFLVSLYTTSVIADSSEQPHAIQRMLALPARHLLLQAIGTSVATITIASYVVLVGVGMILNPLAMPSLLTLLLGFPSLLLLIVTAILLMLLMTPLVATTTQRIIVLAIITIPIAWNIVVSTVNLSMPSIDGTIIAAMTTVWGTLLWPPFSVYHHAIHPDYNALTVLFHLIHVCILVGVARIGRRWFAHKSLTIA